MVVLESVINRLLSENSAGLTDKELWGMISNHCRFERAEFESAMYRLLVGHWVLYSHPWFFINRRK